jgi:ribosomal-protein-alanine N-acetyltransferase
MSQKSDKVGFRRARREDISAWVGPLERASNAVPWSEHLLGGEVESPYSVFWVAEVGDAPAGFVIVHMVGDEAEILEIVVSEELRGAGVGRKLMEQARETARARGCAALFLEVRPSNTPARALYERLGFEPVGLRKRYYRDNDEDAIVMRLDLIPVT